MAGRIPGTLLTIHFFCWKFLQLFSLLWNSNRDYFIRLSCFCFSTYIPFLLIFFHPFSFLLFFELHFSLTFPTKCTRNKTQYDKNYSLISIQAKIKNIGFYDSYHAFSSNWSFTIINRVAPIKNYNANYYVNNYYHRFTLKLQNSINHWSKDCHLWSILTFIIIISLFKVDRIVKYW